MSSDTGEQYLENGYYGIARAAYGLYPRGYGESRALMLTGLISAVKIIGEDVGSLPLFTFEQTGQTQRTAREHPLYARLHDSPNPDMTAIHFRGAMTAQALLHGVSYAKIDRARGEPDRILALWPIEANEMRKDVYQQNRTAYIYTPRGGPQQTLTRRDIFTLNAFGLTGHDGCGILEYGRNAIGLGLAQEEYANRFFSQDQTPNIVLKHPGKLGAEGVKGVKKAWKGEHEDGSPKTPADWWHEPRVLQEGMELEQLHPDNQRSQLIEQRAFQLLEVCRLTRLAPHKLAELGRATWGNLSAQNTQHYNECLRPWLVRWEQSLKLWCFGAESPFYAEHEIGGMLRGDFQTQTEGFRTLLAAGVYSVNEVRGYLNLNPIEGGDEHFIQLNQGTLQDVAGQLDQQQQQQDQTPGPRLVRVGGKP